MAAPTVYDNVAQGAHLDGQLFAGKKFWVAQRVFSRPHYLDLIRSNGGEVVLLEKKADYLIADHVLRNCPPGSLSYTFIEKSIEKGEIQDPENHRAGPAEGTARAPGSLSRPKKGTRTAYTAEDDRILYKWVRDCEAAGQLANGNEIYKQLEMNNPRHTWQSWRDRYVKSLQRRTPSSSNIPENTPPSLPSDAPVKPAAAPVRTQTTTPTTNKSNPDSAKTTRPDQVNSAEYTVDELTAEGLFDKKEWEMLYAFAADLNAHSGEGYRKKWEGWAEHWWKKEGRRQTAGQWRQYFEKVVLPQWQQDPDEKHQRVKTRVERRLQEEEEEEAEQSEEGAPNQDEPKPGHSTPRSKTPNTKRKRTDPDDKLFESYLNEQQKGKASSAYVLFAREKKWALWHEKPELDYAGLHRLLMSQWDALSSEEKTPYFAREAAENSRATNETTALSSQVFLSSSTVGNETPKYITEAYAKALQQIREGLDTEAPPVDAQEGAEYPAKRRKSESPERGTQLDPIEISSAGTDSQSLTQDELPEVKPAKRSIEGDSADMGALEAASNSPTPRPSRYKATAFDTQAILSSPSQGASLSALPLPARLTQMTEAETEDGGDKLASDASTTESLQEFSQFVNEDSPTLVFVPLPQPLENSPPHSPASTASSTSSSDPDPPLAPDEVDNYFEEQHADGFSDDLIAAALKHTRWRPELASEVLQAWKKQQPLPDKRGIWTAEDDEEVEAGDGMALARLESKHTLDGWGGITERMNFLAKYRSAKA